MTWDSAPRDRWGNRMRRFRCKVTEPDYSGLSFWHEFWAEDSHLAEQRAQSQFPGKRIDYLMEVN
jgi:hypothetical protein